MTERLYYHDPKLLSFEATIAATDRLQGRTLTILNRSAFYPTSGGQLFDRGTLNGVDVLEVLESPEGEVWHFTQESAGSVGQTIQGVVDGSRRRKNCQQHTAQHILSQSFARLRNLETVSVHLGEEYGAIELTGGIPSEADREEAALLTNKTILENAPVDILFVEHSELGSIPLRKLPDRKGTIRIIKIGEFDWSACGGTHCQSTAEVSLVKIIGCERMREHALVKFLSGTQALGDYTTRFQITDRLARQFTCHVDDLEGKVVRIIAENKTLRKHVEELQKQTLPLRVEQLAQQCRVIGTRRVVSAIVSGLDGSLVSALAQTTAGQIGGLCILLADERVVVAAGAGSGMHAGNIVKSMASRFGLRGGGNEQVAQVGGAKAAHFDEYVSAMVDSEPHA